MGSKQKPVIIISILVLAVITASILFGTGVIEFGKKSSPESGDSATDISGEAIPEAKDSVESSDKDVPQTPINIGPGKYTCIVRGIDLDSCLIELYDIDTGADVEFTFTAATRITTSYNSVISAQLLRVGDVVDVVSPDGSRLDSISGDSDFKTHKDVMRFKFDRSIGRLTAGNDVYKYDDRILVLDGTHFIDVDDLDSLDVISLFYRDNTVFFIKVVSSHGFLSFAASDDFTGGTVSINGNETGYQIAPGLSIPLAVGEYSVYVENLELSASADIRIDSHKTAVFDLSPFGRVPVTYGDVNFNIYPEGALLYIDGVNTLYSEPVSIPEGSHSIRVELGGYIAFTGTIEVSPSGGTFNISLPPAPVASNDPPEDLLYNDSDEAAGFLSDEVDQGSDATDGGDNEGFIFDDSTSDSADSAYQSDTGDKEPEDDRDETAGDTPDSITTDHDNTSGYEESGSSSGLKLIISCTEGTSVYINGNLAATVTGGTAVCDKPRPGTVTVRLVLDGHISRTYTVTIEDDGEDAIFSFPAMVKQ